LSGNRVDRQLGGGRCRLQPLATNMRHHRARIDNGFLAVAALAVDAPNPRLSDDVALTKATVSLLAARDIAGVRERLDPAMGQVFDDTLRQMSDLIGASEPISIETIWSTETRNLRTGDGNSRILLECELTGKWVVVDAVVKTQGASKRADRRALRCTYSENCLNPFLGRNRRAPCRRPQSRIRAVFDA
jgi:hypothetical protein